jgi:hypothetical protein
MDAVTAISNEKLIPFPRWGFIAVVTLCPQLKRDSAKFLWGAVAICVGFGLARSPVGPGYWITRRGQSVSASFWFSVCHPSTLRMVIWPAASNAQNSIAAVAAEGGTVWILIQRLNSSWIRSIALVVRALPLAERQAGKGEAPVTSFLQAVGDRRAFEPPFANPHQ